VCVCVCVFTACSIKSCGRPTVGDVRDHVTCCLCHGYLIDAVTVVRCQHRCESRHSSVMQFC